MNNNPKNHNPIQNRAPSQPEPVVQVTNPSLKFAVMFQQTQINYAFVVVEATTPADARKKARAYDPHAIKKWLPGETNRMEVVDVRLAKEGVIYE